MIHFFLSHSTKDKEFVIEFDMALRENGINTFRDDKNIRYGETIPTKIYNEIQNSAYFIFFISRNSLDSNWVKEEFATANMLEKNRGYRFIIPVLIDDIDIPVEIVSKRVADFKDRIIDQSKINNLLKLIDIDKIKNKAKINESFLGYYEKGIAAMKRFEYDIAKRNFNKFIETSDNNSKARLLYYICDISNTPIHSIRREYIDEISRFINLNLKYNDYLSICLLGILHLDYYKKKYITPVGRSTEEVMSLANNIPNKYYEFIELNGIKYSIKSSILLNLRKAK